MNLKNNFSILGVFFIALIIASCNKDCPEQNVDDINAIYLDFKTTGDNAFTPEQLQSLFMVRYQTDTLDTLSYQADTFLYYQDGFYADEYKIRLSKYLPLFVEVGAPYYSAYNYSIQGVGQDINILITDIELVGGYDEDDCVYTNTQKTFKINGIEVDATGSQDYVVIENL